MPLPHRQSRVHRVRERMTMSDGYADGLLDAMINPVAMTTEHAAEEIRELLMAGLVRVARISFEVEVQQDDGSWLNVNRRDTRH